MARATKPDGPAPSGQLFPSRPLCPCHGWPACVHFDNHRPDPAGRDPDRGWNWHCILHDCHGYDARLVVLHEWALEDLAGRQRENARQLADAVAKASAAGVPWRVIGDALGIAHEAAWRQHKAGSPIVVVKAFHSKRETEETPA